MAARTATAKDQEREHGNGNREHGRGAHQPFPMSANPISDLLFDWVTVLQSKAHAIAAYEKYIRDAEEAEDQESAELFRKLHEQDVWQVKEIKQHLEYLMFEEEE